MSDCFFSDSIVNKCSIKNKYGPRKLIVCNLNSSTFLAHRLVDAFEKQQRIK